MGFLAQPGALGICTELTRKGAALKLCWFDNHRLGVVREDHVLDVTAALESITLDRYPLCDGDPVVGQLDRLVPLVDELAAGAAAIPLHSVRLLSPVARPTKIIGTPANYLKHVEEAAEDIETFTTRYAGTVREQGLFLKAVSSLVGPSEGVRLRFPDRRTDHEMELAVIIGTKASAISASDALAHVAGYAIGLDMVVRGPEDRSFRKSVDTYAVLGPWMTTADELDDPQNIDFSLSVNGELRQRSNTRYMIVSITEQIAWASQFYTLWPGDVIMTGTCEGVGRVHPGDDMHCEISQVGSMDVRVCEWHAAQAQA